MFSLAKPDKIAEGVTGVSICCLISASETGPVDPYHAPGYFVMFSGTYDMLVKKKTC